MCSFLLFCLFHSISFLPVSDVYVACFIWSPGYLRSLIRGVRPPQGQRVLTMRHTKCNHELSLPIQKGRMLSIRLSFMVGNKGLHYTLHIAVSHKLFKSEKI